MKRLTKKIAEEIAVKVCGSKKGLTDTSNGKIIKSYEMKLGEEIKIEIAEDIYDKKYICVDVAFNDHHAPAWYDKETLENDIKKDDDYRNEVRRERIEEFKSDYGLH
jgi:hypothetical protein